MLALDAMRGLGVATVKDVGDYWRLKVPELRPVLADLVAAGDLETALSRLDREDRAVVWLHDVEGYNHREIAGLFGKSESFSKTRLSRARAKLRVLLGSGQETAATGH